MSSSFVATRVLIEEGKITPGHDISDGGFIVCLLEMCCAGNCGLEINFSRDCDLFSAMFNEEAGWILEVQESDLPAVINLYQQTGVKVQHIAYSSGAGKTAKVVVEYNSEVILDQLMVTLRDIWEETSFKLEVRQTNDDCMKAEKLGLSNRGKPSYSVSFDTLNLRPCTSFKAGGRRVAVIREEGINGDREMIASLFMAGFEVWDVTMTDLLMKKVTLSKFQGVVFPGGFSYADVLGSARGWAAGLFFSLRIRITVHSFQEPSRYIQSWCVQWLPTYGSSWLGRFNS